MRPTFRYLGLGDVLKKSLTELKTQTNAAIRLDGLRQPPSELELANFTTPTPTQVKVFTDADLGGFSTATFDLLPLSERGLTYGRFSGTISLDLPPNRPEIQRSGYAAFRTLDPVRTIWGKSYHNIEHYTHLALRVKSDGDSGKYFVNLQTNTLVPTDIHQHRLYTTQKGVWENVYIPLSDFLRTNFGKVVEPQEELNRAQVRTVGVGLIDRIPGPFELCIQRVWATNKEADEPEVTVDENEKIPGMH
ncbi:CIA30-domain-containing protein [Ascobolus immersus RN42]|uniref:CIA30-domain-containing protein n=1 Tax=Ascobolus immersus RN42 TaxID=1160509 RepID=A0A3N4ILV4_ASCIM|nr:CIA30-domain-containing protein [Ascobolus immersus RN42]